MDTTLASVSDHVFIGGHWDRAAGTDAWPVYDSRDGTALAVVGSASGRQIDEAVRAAQRALPEWSGMELDARLGVLADVAQRLTVQEEQLTDVLVREVGQVRHVAADVQVREPIDGLTAIAEHVRDVRWHERVRSSDVVRVPVGVVAAITPWNYPLTTLVAKVAPALAVGCTVIVKPTEIAPLDALLFAEACRGAGVPDGVFNVVTGTGPDIGAKLVAHPVVDMVTLTGSTRAGREVAAMAAQTLKRVHLELGGKSACVVLHDADLPAAIESALASCFLNSGQICTAQSRILVPNERLAEAEELASEIVSLKVVGDPFDDGVDLGPLASAQHRDRVAGYIRAGMDEGAAVIAGGHGRPDGVDEHGYYVRPTVFSRASNRMTIAQDEIFGPVAVLLSYDTERDAIDIANDTPYGLSGAVWAATDERAAAVAAQIDAGQVLLNGARSPGVTPFGGVKQSGYGREGGRFGVEEYLVYKALHRLPVSAR